MHFDIPVISMTKLDATKVDARLHSYLTSLLSSILGLLYVTNYKNKTNINGRKNKGEEMKATTGLGTRDATLLGTSG
jgi:hypothetical protein